MGKRKYAFLGNYGEQRKQIVGLSIAVEEEKRLDECARLSDVRRITYHERIEYQQLINVLINTIARKHEEDEILKRVRMKRQRKAEWIEQRNRLPKLTADVYFDRENVDNILKGGMVQAEDKRQEDNTNEGIVNIGHIDDHDGFKNGELCT